MATGTVKWFNIQKGFGFIKPDDGGADIFVHISAVERSGLKTLAENQSISYELYKDERRGKTDVPLARLMPMCSSGRPCGSSVSGSSPKG